MVYCMVKVLLLLLGVVSFKFIFPGLMSQFINIILLLLKILEVNYGQILGYLGFVFVFLTPGCRAEWEDSLGRKWDEEFSLIQKITLIDVTDIC